ncbi:MULTISPECIES: ImmA/IrrE family metallo-endopeptidase [Bacillus]|uniref:ImmA/IrrE family metallo-endopeptidase n=1 Tax=Bacillus TaxID=1386 RepID=UPI00224B8D9B|nr:ImmA/IrrE family metallo-endopeptidase [Bacillus sp. KeR2]MCX2854237.1 ImmA/IrrE family metallo-endopeptidase [Bacillus sp. KeR2]
MYRLSPLEQKIKNIYEKINITKPGTFDLDIVAERLKVIVQYWEKDSKGVEILGMGAIILNSQLSKEEQWQDFSHELGHILNHVGIQTNVHYLFKELQENQANAFMYHFAVPTFMLRNLALPATKREAITHLSNLFHVTYSFAETRLDMYLRKLFSFKYHAFLAQRLEKEKFVYAEY